MGCMQVFGPASRRPTQEEFQRDVRRLTTKLMEEDQKMEVEAAVGPVLRLKMCVTGVKSVSSADGTKQQEEIYLSAVYSSDPNSSNARWSKYTPSASLQMNVSNPDAFGKVLPGQFMFVDLTPTTKEA